MIMLRARPIFVRHQSGSSQGLPFRIRSPLAKLQEKKNRAAAQGPAARPGTLGDGEKLESMGTGPDYVRLALTSRVYDMIQESPLQYASGLSSRLQARVHSAQSAPKNSLACTLPAAGQLAHKARGPAPLLLLQDPRRLQPYCQSRRCERSGSLFGGQPRARRREELLYPKSSRRYSDAFGNT